MHSIQNHPEFPEFDKKLKKLIKSKKTSLMQEFRFWPTSPPRQLGGVFELRSYTLHPGNLLEWETHWQKGLAARREVMEGEFMLRNSHLGIHDADLLQASGHGSCRLVISM